MLLRSYATVLEMVYGLLGLDPADAVRLPINSFGLFVALGFLSAAFFTYKELKRRKGLDLFTPTYEKVMVGEGAKWQDLVVPFILWFIIGLKGFGVWMEWDLFQSDPQTYIASASGFLPGGLILGALAAGWVYWRKNKGKLAKPEEKKEAIYPHDHVGIMLVVCAASGLVGANVVEWIIHPEQFKEFLADPIGSMFSGFTIVGGLIFGIGAMLIYARAKKIPVFHLFDAIAPGFFTAYGIGRIGCHVSGDGDWGKPVSMVMEKPGFVPEFLWQSDYAHNVANDGKLIEGCREVYCRVLEEPHLVTPIWEMAASMILFGILWSLRKRLTPVPGMLFAIFLVFNGAERFLIEFVRVTNKVYFDGTLSLQQVVSAILVIAGIIITIRLFTKNKDKILKA